MRTSALARQVLLISTVKPAEASSDFINGFDTAINLVMGMLLKEAQYEIKELQGQLEAAKAREATNG